jgi:hypothetical protein
LRIFYPACSFYTSHGTAAHPFQFTERVALRILIRCSVLQTRPNITLRDTTLKEEFAMKHVPASLTIASCLLLAVAGTTFASPTGTPQQNPTTGQKGAPTNTCPGTSGPPGNAGSPSNPGSPFNGSATPGQAGNVYAGNPGTASLANSNSTASVSQYDVACFQAP